MTSRAVLLTDTTLGRKFVMALSGVVLFGYVIAHMLGNLLAFVGQKALNEYSKALHDAPTLLWTARCALLVAVVAHVVTSLQLTLQNRGARPVSYRMRRDAVTSYAARTMAWSGPILLFYILYHLAHLTFGVTAGLGYEHLPLDPNGLPDVYHNLVHSFRVPWCAGLYIVANLALGVHLYHGAWSFFQSLGISHTRYDDALRSGAVAIAMATMIGFIAVPVGVLVGALR
jgi:succinate dehydrogenase / fumarate reductase cytochrome b subunit